jgi:hypothetical protein
MSQTISESTGTPYGVQRVCRVWEQARSTCSARQVRTSQPAPLSPARRGPKPAIADDQLLALIRDDLAASPFQGEGHRKVWARLRFVQGLPVSRKLRFWGITPSFAFVAEPGTNGVAERFIRTLKEQAVYARIFRTAAEVGAAVEEFVRHYNAQWLVEKNGFRSPAQA